MITSIILSPALNCEALVGMGKQSCLAMILLRMQGITKAFAKQGAKSPSSMMRLTTNQFARSKNKCIKLILK